MRDEASARSFRARLRAIAASQARGEAAATPPIRGAAPVAPADVWPAGWAEGFWDCHPAWPDGYPLPPRPLDPGVVVLDVESMGRSSKPVFLIGLAGTADGSVKLRQLLAAHPEQEEAVLREAGRVLASARTLITYNGSSFDLPLLRERWAGWMVPAPPLPFHVDLLAVVRRRYRTPRGMSSCQLARAEEFILGVARPEDMASSEVPALYERAILAGDARPLVPILRHNAYDLAATTLIYQEVAAQFPQDLQAPRPRVQGEDLFGNLK